MQGRRHDRVRPHRVSEPLPDLPPSISTLSDPKGMRFKRRVLPTAFLALAALALASPIPAAAQAASGRLALRPALTIDGKEFNFGRIGAVVAGADGRIYVADVHQQARQIVIFDARGQRSGQRGGAGAGPGEFLSLHTTLAFYGSSLAAIDDRQRPVRITLWDSQGGVSTRDWPGSQTPSNTTLFSGGDRLYGSAFISSYTALDFGETPQQRPELVPVLLAFEAEGASSISMPDTEAYLLRVDGEDCRAGGTIHPFSRPLYDGGPFIAFLPGGEVARSRRDSFRIEVVNLQTGQVVRTYRRDVQPRALTDEVWAADRWVRGARRIEQEFGRLSGLDGQPCGILERPAVEPLIRSMVSDDAGRLWVESTTTQGTTLTGIGPRGELLGEAFMPARDMRVAPYVRGDRLYLTTIDDLDVQSVEVFDIVWE